MASPAIVALGTANPPATFSRAEPLILAAYGSDVPGHGDGSSWMGSS